MSLFDYEAYRALPAVPFASLIMAAYQKADTINAPGGVIAGDPS